MQGNDGDVAAKDESQASVAQLGGYAAGISLLTFSHAPAYLYSIFFLAVPLHLTMTAYMMRVATFELLTLPRISYLAQAYVTDGEVDSQADLDAKGATGLFGEFYKTKNDRWLVLAPRVGDVLSSGSGADRSTWKVCSQVFQVRLPSTIPVRWVRYDHEAHTSPVSSVQDDRYLLIPCDSPRGALVSVLFHPDATNDDMLAAILHAALVRSVLLRSVEWPNPPLRQVLSETSAQVKDEFPDFQQALRARGWRTNELCFADHGHRVTWAP